jgi:hypothetical protein
MSSVEHNGGGGEGGSVEGPEDISVAHPLVIAACYYYGFRAVWLRSGGHERAVGLFTGIMAGALYATCAAFLTNMDDPLQREGIKVDMIRPVYRSLLTLGGCVVLPFYESFNARIGAMLTNLLMAHVLSIGKQMDWKWTRNTEISSIVVISKLAILVLGQVGVRGLVRLGEYYGIKRLAKMEYYISIGIVVMAGVMEMIMGRGSLYVLATISVCLGGGLSRWFMNKEELMVVLMSNILGIGCIFVASRVVVIYGGVAGYCYMSYKYETKRYQYLSLATISLGLLGVSLVATESLTTDKIWQPYAVVGFFMLVSSITVRLIAKRRFPAMLSGFVFFPLLYIIACCLDRAQLSVRVDNMKLFQELSLMHTISIMPIILGYMTKKCKGEKGWTLSYILLSHTGLFQLGYEGGNLWFKEKIFRLETVFRVAALLSSFSGFFRSSWEMRYYSLVVSLTVSEFFLSPFSAIALLCIFWATRAVPSFFHRLALVRPENFYQANSGNLKNTLSSTHSTSSNGGTSLPESQPPPPVDS